MGTPPNMDPALLLTKTASPLTYSTVGQTINYNYDLKNTGNVPLNSPFAVTDNKATVVCPQPASLAVNATLTCTASYNITQPDLNNGSVTNLATATGKFGSGTVTSSQAQATVTATAHPSLLLVKSATPTSYSAIGNIIAYNYLVTNNGNVALAGTLSIVDNKVSVTCTPSSVTLAPGQSSTCTASHSITQADLDAGSITNKATASLGSTPSNESVAIVNATQLKALSLKKTAAPGTYDHVNASISYNYELKNIGNVTLFSPFDVLDNKTSATCPATPTSLAPGGTIVCTATYSIVQADLDFGSVTNEAQGSAKFQTSTVLSNKDHATVTAVAHPSLSLAKSATPVKYAAVDQDVFYEYTLTNNGNVTLVGPFSVSDNKVANVVCPAVPGSLAPGDSTICSVTYKITQADLDAGSISNDATASNGTVTSNHAQATINADQTRALSLLKSSPTANYNAVGNTLSYAYLVKNIGNVTLNGPFTVSDDKTTVTCPAVPSSLAPNQSITCNATYQTTQADLDAGSVKNTATATNGTVTSNPSSVMIGAIQSALLQLDKSADKTTYETLNEVIQYTYVLTNGGNVTLKAPYTVGDDKTSVTCTGTADLAPGNTTTCSASYTVSQADLDGGSVKNTATGHAKFGSVTVDSNPDSVTVAAISKTGLTLTKKASPAKYTQVGDTLSYVYTILNSGNVTLSGPFTVADDKTSVSCPNTASLAPGSSIDCTASYPVTQADLDSGAVINTATANNGTVFSNETSATVPAMQNASLSLAKSATPGTYSALNAPIVYSFVLKNVGNVTLAAPFTVSDDKLGALTCPSAPATLAPSASFTCSAPYNITQADLDAGLITNNATGHATFGKDTIDSNLNQATITAIQHPALTLDKTAQESSYVKAGDLLHYSYLVTNAGNVTLHDPIVVNDDKATTVICPALPAAGLAPGASITCTATYAISQNDLDAGALTNIASATSGNTVSPSDKVTVNAEQKPGLKLSKSADPTSYSLLGQLIDYKYIVENNGNVTLQGPFSVADDKGIPVTCAAPASLAPADTMECHASYAITQADLDAGSVTNHAEAQAFFGGNPVKSPMAQVTITAVQTRALSLDKTAIETTYASAGDEIHYDYLVTNVGNVTLHDAIAINDNKTTATCDALPLTGLAPLASIHCTATYVVQQADLDSGAVTNIATASSGPTLSPSDTVTVPATQRPELKLTKTAGPTPYSQLTDIINYSYLLENTGNVTLVGPFSVTDDKVTVTCPASPASLAPSATTTCTATHPITQADLDAGAIKNTATAAAAFDGKAVKSEPDSATVYANQTALLQLVKKATLSGNLSLYNAPGQSIHYTYDVTNIGNVTLDGPITVSDDKASVSCPPTSHLAPGATLQCDATHVIDQADIDAGSVTNTATAHAVFLTKPVDSNDANVTVNADQKPVLKLTKDANPKNYDAVGQTIAYSYKLKNDGNVTLVGPFTVTDDKIAVTCPPTPSTLLPSAEIECSATYTITQADLDRGFITNTAAGHAFFKSAPVQSDDSVATVNAVANKQLSLSKTASPLTYAHAGETINYQYVIKNIGNVTLSGPFSITDNKASVTCPPGDLAPLATLTCSASYSVSQADVDFGSVTNTATASNGTVTSNKADATVEAVQNRDLTLVKTASLATYKSVGQVIVYSYKLVNAGNVTLIGPFSVLDNKLGLITCPAGNLAPGDSLICTASYTVQQSDLDAGHVDNSATASNATITSNEAKLSVPADQKPDLMLVKLADPATYTSVGQPILYSYALRNVGNVTLNPPYAVSDNKASVICPNIPAALAPGETVTCTASYSIKQSDLDNGEVTNHADAVAHFGSADIPSNPADATITAGRAPALSLSKTATPKTFNAAGTIIHYDYGVKNVGNVTLPGPFSVNDDKLGALSCPSGSLAPGASVTCTASYTTLQSDVEGAGIKNTAAASTLYGPNSVVSNDATESVTPQQNAALTLSKVAKPLVYSSVGQTIVYTYVVTNVGNVTLDGPFMISDNKLGAFPCLTVTSLAPGASVTCTKSYVIQASDLNSPGSGSITNIATAAGKFKTATVTSAQAQATVRQQSSTGLLTDTSTTCSDFAAGTVSNLTELLYLAKNRAINSVAPGVLFYYSMVTAPSANFTLQFGQTNASGFPVLGIQQESKNPQVLLFEANCVRSSKQGSTTITVDPITKKQTVSVAVSGATTGQVFYVSVKYSVKPLIGTTVTTPLPTVTYNFLTSVNGVPVLTSQDSLALKPKGGVGPDPSAPTLYLPLVMMRH